MANTRGRQRAGVKRSGHRRPPPRPPPHAVGAAGNPQRLGRRAWRLCERPRPPRAAPFRLSCGPAPRSRCGRAASAPPAPRRPRGFRARRWVARSWSGAGTRPAVRLARTVEGEPGHSTWCPRRARLATRGPLVRALCSPRSPSPPRAAVVRESGSTARTPAAAPAPPAPGLAPPAPSTPPPPRSAPPPFGGPRPLGPLPGRERRACGAARRHVGEGTGPPQGLRALSLGPSSGRRPRGRGTVTRVLHVQPRKPDPPPPAPRPRTPLA